MPQSFDPNVNTNTYRPTDPTGGAASYAPPGQGLTAEESRLISEELSVQGIRPRGIAGIAGARFPASISEDELTQVVGFAEQWAGNMGWAEFPTFNQIMSVYNQGISDYTDAARAFGMFLPQSVKDAKPWATLGVSADQWHATERQQINSFRDLTGVDVEALGMGSIIHQAVAENWGQQRWQSYMNSNQTIRQQFGWIRHGLTYTQMQQAVQDNKKQLESRYGVGAANASNLVANLDDPLVANQAQSVPINYAAKSGSQTWTNQNPMMETTDSKVRQQ